MKELKEGEARDIFSELTIQGTDFETLLIKREITDTVALELFLTACKNFIEKHSDKIVVDRPYWKDEEEEEFPEPKSEVSNYLEIKRSKREKGTRAYHTLLEREKNGKWQIVFGDYTMPHVQQEKLDLQDSSDSKFKIITTGDKQEQIQEAVNYENSRLGGK